MLYAHAVAHDDEGMSTTRTDQGTTATHPAHEDRFGRSADPGAATRPDQPLDPVDVVGGDSFPASDPPSWWASAGT